MPRVYQSPHDYLSLDTVEWDMPEPTRRIVALLLGLFAILALLAVDGGNGLVALGWVVVAFMWGVGVTRWYGIELPR